MQFIATPFERGQRRAERNKDADPKMFIIDEAAFIPDNNRQRVHRRIQRRGYVQGVIPCNEFGQPYDNRPAEVFSEIDRTVKRFTVAQAYEQAAMVIRTRRGLSPCTPIFPVGSYNAKDETQSLTMEGLSDLVNELTWNR